MTNPISIIANTITCYNTNGLIIFYDDRSNPFESENAIKSTLTLKSNNITMTNYYYLITGLYISTSNKINIMSLDNLFIPETLLLCNPEARQNGNISIIETE